MLVYPDPELLGLMLFEPDALPPLALMFPEDLIPASIVAGCVDL